MIPKHRQISLRIIFFLNIWQIESVIIFILLRFSAICSRLEGEEFVFGKKWNIQIALSSDILQAAFLS